MFCFSTLMTYGQNQLFIHEKSDKEDLKRFMQHPSVQEKFFQNNENEFFTQEHPLLNTKTKPTAKQLNTSKANKQCLDSLVIYQYNKPLEKEIFEYDNNGNMVSCTYYWWDNESNDLKMVKSEYEYDNNNNRTLEVWYWWNNETNNWEEYRKYEWTYDNNGNLILEINYCGSMCDYDTKREYKYDNNGNCTLMITWTCWYNDPPNNWKEYYKHEYTYDNNGNLKKQIYYEWDYYATNNWRERFKYEYTYDNNNNLILRIFYEWDYYATNNWREKEEYTYDNNNNLILQISYAWNDETNSWRVSGKIEHTYDNNNNLILQIFYAWDDETNSWRVSGKIEHTYDNNGNKTLEANYYWDDETNNWGGLNKFEWAYDENGNTTLRIHYKWGNATNNWKEYYKYEYTYDNNGNLKKQIYYGWIDETNSWWGYRLELEYDLTYSITDLIFDLQPSENKWFFPMNMCNMLTKVILSELPIGDDVPYFFYWSNKEIGISDITTDNSSIKVYPNPTTGELTIDNGQLKINNVEIFDIYGRKQKIIINYQLSIINSINISHFPTGIYFVKIRTEAGEIVRKIIKE